MRHRLLCHWAEGLRRCVAASGPHYRAVEVKWHQMRSVPWYRQMRGPAESGCCGATSRGRDIVTGPQVL
ncbi:hypothetical protein NDU88_002307 [Pleurodeles waltl]|uniref:Uncharacterized protein n=1 Tax=Pleurodeles waltl TaxID=8319 RepID=A0AAV7UX78_PLEWA|nr:hypothetical protein NDU88_002307 [Pleurodeles waltl]